MLTTLAKGCGVKGEKFRRVNKGLRGINMWPRLANALSKFLILWRDGINMKFIFPKNHSGLSLNPTFF